MSALSRVRRAAVSRSRPRFTHRLWRRHRGDRGAVATIVAILLAGGVLLGMAALTVDVGMIYAEREDLQSGADAAALAVARNCSLDPADCGSDALGLARSYANLNARDGKSQVDAADVCGRDPGHTLAACGSQPNGLTRCLGSRPSSPQPYIEVRVSTKTSNNQHVLPAFFSQTLAGNGGGPISVEVCARASWTTANQAVAFAISICEFREDTNDGPADWPLNPGSAGDLETTFTDNSGVHGLCSSSSTEPGWSRPGPFVWLQREPGTCTADVGGDDRIDGDDPFGDNWPTNCRNLIAGAQSLVSQIWIPVYDGVHHHTFSDDEYHIAGYVPLRVAGYVNENFDRKQSVGYFGPLGYPCNWMFSKCISGYYMSDHLSNNPGATATVIATLIG